MKKIDLLLEEVISEIRAAGINPNEKISPEVVINTRAKTRFGCCKVNRLTGECVIELSESMLKADEKFIKSTLAHEVLHSCCGCQNHGKRWKLYAQRLNFLYGYNITVTNKPEDFGLQSEAVAKEPLYVLKCTNCGLEIPRMKMSKSVMYPQSYRCSKCGGKIVRIK